MDSCALGPWLDAAYSFKFIILVLVPETIGYSLAWTPF